MSSKMLPSIIKQFSYYKRLGERTMHQLTDDDLFWRPDENTNSIAIIIKHLHGNMLSRWTAIFDTDGEKPWRKRDQEFILATEDAQSIRNLWEDGWSCLLGTLETLEEQDLDRVIYIRNEGHTVLEAIQRQLSHYPYHIGQLVFLGKMIKGDAWQNLSITPGKSNDYNTKKFDAEKAIRHFTDDV